MKIFRNQYRVVRDGYAGYEAQFKPWFWPFWMQCNWTNTSATLETAENICHGHAAGSVKYLGRLP